MMDFSKRLGKLRALMEGAKLGSVLVTDPNDIFYYAGHKPVGDDSAFLLVKQDSAALFVSPLENQASELKGVEVVFIKKLTDVLGDVKGAWVMMSTP